MPQKPNAVLTVEPNWSTFYSGEFVTFTCDRNEAEATDWEYRLNRDNEPYLSINPDKSITLEPLQHSGEFQCCGRRRSSNKTKCSNTVTVSVSNKVVVTRQPNSSHVFSGETITLTCGVQGGETTEWKCDWKRDGSLIHKTNSKDWTFIVSKARSRNYMCRCIKRDDWFSSTQWSEAVTLSVSGGVQERLNFC
ncbi:Fc receptor-like protein 4 [Poecilia formosa]|uniref:Fc receptor-like protein 4 n=1 Tax=Poecilia formosa TaxID=48698 RepID=UPI0007B9CBDA|nr:PREDICTED: Fc receptor-like protein 4 [Poecilia formosa]